MDEDLRSLVMHLETRGPGNLDRLQSVAVAHGISLPAEYIELMGLTDGASGDVGEAWIEFWPLQEIEDAAAGESRYDDVLLFAGDGANTVYGFDARSGSEIVEGDWIGLAR